MSQQKGGLMDFPGVHIPNKTLPNYGSIKIHFAIQATASWCSMADNTFTNNTWFLRV